ncbi:MAG: biopolymer transporter ExbD [Alphaproteobacteria bacterium]|nr:biopolymer transporter ExbD [Alphaproteobacteria bacterium]
MAYVRRKSKIRAEVNLTPLIDVLTSLLAIFMITAPMLTTGIPLNLPKGDGRSLEGQEKILDIGVTDKGKIYVGAQEVAFRDLIRKVNAVVSENPKIQMVISGDRASSYGQVVEVMALLRAAGYTQVGLKTDARIMGHDAPSRKGK